MTRPAINIADLRQRARRRLPRMVFDYLDGGAEDELTVRANRAAFARTAFQPRMLADVSQRNQSIELFGRRLASPMVIAPVGLAGLFWPQGDVAMARAAREAGIPFVLSSAGTSTIEEVAAQAGGDLWFQLYVISRTLADGLVQRALDAGYTTLVLTVDVPVGGLRERDVRNDFTQPFRMTPRAVFDVLRHPGWLAGIARHGAPQLANMASATATDADSQAALLKRQMDASYDWAALERLRARWPHRLLVKGILHPEDARRAFALGVDGVIVSNHGGRQLDGALASLDALPGVVAAAEGRPVLVDGGVRRGADVVKALALGASAVLLGRAAQYGLAAAGQAGAAQALAILRTEIDRVLALCAVADVSRLSPALLAPSGLDAPLPASALPPT